MGKHDKPEKKDKDEKPSLVFRLPCKNGCPIDCLKCGYFWVKYLDDGGTEYTPARWTPEKVEKILYTADAIRESLKPKWDTYYAKLAIGQSPTWKCDQRTAEMFCLSQWLIEELMAANCPQEDRWDVQNYFNRKTRAEDDLYEVAARSMNTFVEGKIERVRRQQRVRE